MLYNPFCAADQRRRAQVVQNIRAFFAERNVLEVDTPLMAAAPVTDPYLQAITARCMGQTYYLQTSPEYAMKRLLAAGSGSIFQICKAFRDEESGRIHRPEFTLLEWYRVGFNDRQLMDEMDQLLQGLTGWAPALRISYQAVFERYVGINPHTIGLVAARAVLREQVGEVGGLSAPSLNDCLQLLFSAVIEPKLQAHDLVFVFDYPTAQAALAKRRVVDGQEVAARFEVYARGVELANGYDELTDPVEQRRRFEADLVLRQQQGLPLVPMDEALLQALEAGMPECAGVALGLDRVLMLLP